MRCGDSAFFAVSARCFRAECAEIPRAASAKLHKMQFLCIAKRVTVNNVNSNDFTVSVHAALLQHRPECAREQ